MDNSFPLDQIPSLRAGVRLSEQLAEVLASSIRAGKLEPGRRLPTESTSMQRFGVSHGGARGALEPGAERGPHSEEQKQ